MKRKPARTSPQLVVLSGEDAEQYEPQGKEICISISDPEAESGRLSPAFAAVLRLAFNDITERGVESDILFAAEHAQAITEFVDGWPDVDRAEPPRSAEALRRPPERYRFCRVVMVKLPDSAFSLPRTESPGFRPTNSFGSAME